MGSETIQLGGILEPMARPQNHPILAQLKSARTTSDQTASLRALKNEIVGHIQRKEAWVALGVLEPIVRTISSRSSLTRPNGKESSQASPLAPAYLSEEDGTKLQALQLVASFAHGQSRLNVDWISRH